MPVCSMKSGAAAVPLLRNQLRMLSMVPRPGVEVAVAVEVGERRLADQLSDIDVGRTGSTMPRRSTKPGGGGAAAVAEIRRGCHRGPRTTASRSPSPSRSAKLGALEDLIPTPANGSTTPVWSAKSGGGWRACCCGSSRGRHRLPPPRHRGRRRRRDRRSSARRR